MIKKILIFLVLILIVLISYEIFFYTSKNNQATFIVNPKDSQKTIILNLKNEGLINSQIIFQLLIGLNGNFKISPGGYNLPPKINILKLISILKEGPVLKWVTIPEGLRKEEIKDILAYNLEWDENQKNNFLNAYQILNLGNDYKEGVYFPDTYLLPKKESGDQIAKRLIDHFNEKFAPFAKEAKNQNIKWTTLLKVASLIQKEAAGNGDMPLISGIIWNRLLKGIKLDIDATVAYARGDTKDGFWSPPKKADLKIDSPYNTYIYKGLPPTPICNPGTEAISAALYPASTTCLYYFHDENKIIHCSNTYQEHQANIKKYLIQ